MKKIKKLTKKELESLAVDLICFLQNHDLFYMINIYVNNKLLTDNKTTNAQHATTPFGSYYIVNDVNPKENLEYYNPETITVTFEGPLYDIINYNNSSLYQQLCDLFEEKGLYIEQGYAWSFSSYYL